MVSMVKSNRQRRALPTFGKFETQMQPCLASVAMRDRDRLLCSLYQLAEMKIKFERERDEANGDVAELRSARKNLSAAHDLLEHALQNINKAQERYPEAMRTIADHLGDLLRDRENALQDGRDGKAIIECPFETIVEYLEHAVDIAGHMAAVRAAEIHPELRKDFEKQLVERALDESLWVGPVPHEVPASPKSAGIDQWFIGETATILDKYRTAEGEKIERYDKIISALFRVAFYDVGRSDENIRTELRRQQTRGRPKYRPLVVNDLRDVGQNLPSRRAMSKKMSGQKKKK
jgi:hypothetical protein